MVSPRRPHLIALLLALTPMLGAGKCRKKPDEEVVEDSGGSEEAQDVAVPLALVSLTPSRAKPGVAQRGTLRGSGFTDGMRVYVGTSEASGVAVQSGTSLTMRLPGLPVGTFDVEVVTADGGSSVLRSGYEVVEERRECRSFTVHFELDQAAVGPADADRIAGEVPCLLEAKSSVTVEGHADERGTTDYNLALGQRRAAAVQRVLVAQGVPPTRIRTISFGEERPVDRGHDEEAWAANRRAEILVRD